MITFNEQTFRHWLKSNPDPEFLAAADEQLKKQYNQIVACKIILIEHMRED